MILVAFTSISSEGLVSLISSDSLVSTLAVMLCGLPGPENGTGGALAAQ